MPNKYYHITKPENLDSIYQNGIKPSNGSNAKLINDTREDRVCLCSKRSIDAWCIMLQSDTVLEIELPDDFELITIDEDNVTNEYVTKDCIPAEYVKRHFTVKPSEKILHELQESYMHSLSYYCVLCARYYTPGTGWRDGGEMEASIKESIQVYGDCIIPVIPRLQYNTMTREEKCRILKSIGDSGDYSFCDDYMPDYKPQTPIKRLYQMLIEYENDEFTTARRKIYNLIKQNFKYCLRTDTGGWTG